MGGRSGDLVRGITASCLLLTVLVVLLAAFADQPQLDAVLRPLYFALLFSFFHAIGRRQPEIAVLPFRLIQSGFAVLTLGSTAAVVVRGLDLAQEPDGVVLTALERGAVFLLGLTLISYGILLWIPSLLESRRVLRQRYDATRGALRLSERARVRMEERFVEADRLHALGELAAGIAHDLRNPLAIVRAAAASLASRPRTPADLDEHTAVIVRNVDKAERTIAALLDLGKPRSLTLQPVDLDALLAEIIALVSVESRRRAIALERRGETGLTAHADHKQLVQVLLNLVLNAIQAGTEGTTIGLRTRGTSVGGMQRIALAVEDRGTGIDPAQRDKLFAPFFTTKREGTGLGLLSCRRLLNDLGGQVDLYPRRRGGTRALVLLQACNQKAAVG
jgi:signal transduction histidine kinase